MNFLLLPFVLVRKEGLIMKDSVKNAIYCADTNVITEDGRKTICEVVPGKDSILVKADNDQTIHFAPVKAIVPVMLTNEKVVKIEGTYVDLYVPTDTRLYVCHKKSLTVIQEKITADDLKACHVMPLTDYEWQGIDEEIFILPAVTKKDRRGNEVVMPEKNIPMGAFCEFVGFYLADGSCNTSCKNGKPNYTVSIKQNVKNEEYVLNLFRGIGYEPTICRYRDGNNMYYVYDKQLWEYMRKLGKSKTKHIPKCLKTLSKNYQAKLLEGFIKGDSSKRGEQEYFVSSISKRLMEDLQEVFLKATGTMYRVNVVNTKYNALPYRYYAINLNLGDKHARNAHFPEVQEERYSGMGYAIILENEGTFLTERNGILNWCYVN